MCYWFNKLGFLFLFFLFFGPAYLTLVCYLTRACRLYQIMDGNCLLKVREQKFLIVEIVSDLYLTSTYRNLKSMGFPNNRKKYTT